VPVRDRARCAETLKHAFSAVQHEHRARPATKGPPPPRPLTITITHRLGLPMVFCVECLPADKPWDVVSACLRTSRGMWCLRHARALAWRGAAGLCARVRACAGAAESLDTYITITMICAGEACIRARQPTYRASPVSGLGLNKRLQSPILYGVWHTKGRSRKGRILPNSRAIVLHQRGQ